MAPTSLSCSVPGASAEFRARTSDHHHLRRIRNRKMHRARQHTLLAFLTLLAVALGSIGVHAHPRQEEGGAASVGPDVIVGALLDIAKYGTVGGISAYSIGTTSCNIGDAFLLWCDSPVAGLCDQTQHPVIAQNMYRLKNGRLEMLGMSWVKHAFCALDESLCSPCQSDPFGCKALGVGCSDPYAASINGWPSALGPRSQVNATTGIFPFPFTAPAAPATIGRRIQVPIAAVDPAQNSGALYFGEGHYVTADDAAAGNSNNNGSYRRMLVSGLSSGSWTIGFSGETIAQKHAIHAWKDHGLGVGVPDPDVAIQTVDVTGDGRFIVACKVSDNGDGTWHYEYAVFNQDSDRSARSWFVPIPASVVVTNLGQNIVSHHSGEPYLTGAWSMSSTGTGAFWSTLTHAQNANANALRWSTMFNFRFDANRPPVTGAATLGLFKSGTSADPSVTVLVPSALPCLADLTGDGVVDGADLALVLGAWGTSGPADLDQSGSVDGADLAIVLGSWGLC